MESVSGLGGGVRLGRWVCSGEGEVEIAHRGINTPGLHKISRSPNGWLPRIYWSGLPLER